MKKITFLITVAFFINFSNLCFSQSYQWVRSIGGTGDDYGCRISIDVAGNCFITGYFTGVVDFDPGAGIANLTSVGSLDIFLAKYDVNGNYIWAKNIGSTSDDYCYGSALDGNGHLYITGSFQGTADFDPGSGIANLISSGGSDVFIAKYDINGNYIWAKKIGSSGNEFGHCVAIDNNGNCYLAGKSTSIVFAKYDINGNSLWIKNIGSTMDNCSNIALDGSGNFYLVGSFFSTLDFDPGTGLANLTSAGWDDIFFAKYDTNGNYIWARNVGSTYCDEGFDIDVDGSGNCYITGSFSNNGDFDPGTGIANLTTVGYNDIFFAKYNSNGNFLWAKSVGSANGENGWGIKVNASGNIYLTGFFFNDVNDIDFDPGPGMAIFSSNGDYDIFFAKYDPNGNYLWANSIGGVNVDHGYDIDVDGAGNCYIIGKFMDVAYFYPDLGMPNLVSAGLSDIFFAKYGSPTGVDELVSNHADWVSIYPNPTNNNIKIELNGISKETIVSIYNIQGKLIVNNKYNNQKPISIDVKSFSKGLYSIKIQTDKGVETKKLVIQ